MVAHTLEAALHELRSISGRLAVERATQVTILKAAAKAQRAADQAGAAAQAATLNAESALHQVKGQLYLLTLKREQRDCSS